MVWSAPFAFTTGMLVTAAILNQYLSDELSYLHGDTGTIAFSAGASFNGALTRQSNTVWDAGNQGSGSGMNADMVDGFHAGHSNGQVAVADGALVTNLNAQLLNGVSETTMAHASDGRHFGLGPISDDWFRNEIAGQGIRNDVTGKGGYFGAGGLVDYPNNYTYWHAGNVPVPVDTTASQTISNKSVSGDLPVSGALKIGGVPASSGGVRLPNGSLVAWRDSGNGFDLYITADSSTRLVLGTTSSSWSTGGGVSLSGTSADSLNVVVNGVARKIPLI